VFGVALQVGGAAGQEASQVRGEEEASRQRPEGTERSFVLERVGHQRAGLGRLEGMDVPERPERAVHHSVLEQVRWLESGDPGGQPLMDPEVPRLERDDVAEPEQPFPRPADDALAGLRD
jgi:hypothetical protein